MTSPHAELKRLAERALKAGERTRYEALDRLEMAATPETILSLIEENERMREAGRTLADALQRYGFPVSGGAKAALTDHGSAEANAVDEAARALLKALQPKEEA